MSTVRERLEQAEERLSPLAARSAASRGRPVPEEEDPWRLSFQRDRDRILHCNSFRRLKHKTQVFVAPAGDHFRTRLTHTLEVSQIARTIARALNLNEDLTEAISLGHDLGHTPFGHAGETALNELVPDGFHHNEQSLRVVDILEMNGRGLNLTDEVREGILYHSKVRESIAINASGVASHLEGQIVQMADPIAYVNHDLEDAIRAGVMTEADVPGWVVTRLGPSRRERINAMVVDVITNCWSIVDGNLPKSAESGGLAIRPSPRMLSLIDDLREFLFRRVYLSGFARDQAEKSTYLIKQLFHYYVAHPGALSDEVTANPRGEPIERLVCDYIAGMTDRYALQAFRELFVPEA
ncbi:MAG TPA: deoxyguanosinetriphosphate triphosphohydrolase [Chloroflexota bacterium]